MLRGSPKMQSVILLNLPKASEEVQDLIQHLTKEIRTTSYLLHPPPLDESGLSSALQYDVQGLSERSGLSVDLNVPERFESSPLRWNSLSFVSCRSV